jgi:hypothetical protein
MLHTQSTTDKPSEVHQAVQSASKRSSGKISKAEAGYQYHPDIQYRCSDCVMMKPAKKGSACCWFGPSVPISPETGSCNYFAHAHPEQKPDVPWLSLFTKEQLGYLENAQGFSCKRCEEFIFPRHECKKVDRNSEGDTPGEISPDGCCDFWQADRRRAKMTNEELVQLMAGR